MPGVSAPDFLNVKDKGLLGGSDLVGERRRASPSNMWTVDGANNNDVGLEPHDPRLPVARGDRGVQDPPQQLRRRVRPGAPGAQINIVTRGGTNEFHGARSTSAGATRSTPRTISSSRRARPRRSCSRNDFGWTFGGPIMKDKLHFFVSQEWNRELRGTRAHRVRCRRPRERAGDFSRPRIAGCSSPTPIDPLTGAPFPGNRIPANRLSPGGAALPAALPAAQHRPRRRELQQLGRRRSIRPINWRQENIRLDWTPQQHDPPHAALHPGRLDERRSQPLHATSGATTRSRPWTRTGTSPASSLMAQLNQNIGSSAVNTPAVLVLRQQDHDHAGRRRTRS